LKIGLKFFLRIKILHTIKKKSWLFLLDNQF
jgi:hypothetical protein